MKRVDIAELLAGDDFHDPDCWEGSDVDEDGEPKERVTLCTHDCIWHRVDEAVEEIRSLRKKIADTHRLRFGDGYSSCTCGHWHPVGRTTKAEAKRRHAAHVKRVTR